MTGDSSSGNHLDSDDREMQALRASVIALEKKVDGIVKSLQQLAASLNVPNEPIVLEGNRGAKSKSAEELAESVTQVHADVKAKLQQSNTKYKKDAD
ncbi:hypothetical protein LWI29_006881 [Acer saccharum]|uniref:Uncharacterized protein n=1 Tax=Acer saccharum TaxID=4024 RepID=A0AA39UQB2_ACESA|nr:hypothetical protein LWI29_006881 [Acer saccharum]